MLNPKNTKSHTLSNDLFNDKANIFSSVLGSNDTVPKNKNNLKWASIEIFVTNKLKRLQLMIL